MMIGVSLMAGIYGNMRDINVTRDRDQSRTPN